MNGLKFVTLGVAVICIWSTFDLLVLKVILGSFCALVSEWLVTRKTFGCRVKWSETRASLVVVTCIWGTFDLLVLKFILGLFDALVSK